MPAWVHDDMTCSKPATWARWLRLGVDAREILRQINSHVRNSRPWWVPSDSA